MIAVLLGWLLAAAAPASSFRIAGTVVNSVTRQPVAGAQLNLAPVEHVGQRVDAIAGADGRFAFAGLPAGKYVLAGQRHGLLQALTGSIVAGHGQDTESIVLALVPPGAVTGKVVDDAGEPVEHASVELLSSRIVSGRRRVRNFASAQTDDLGEYRFSSVPPGTYYVTASGHPWYTKFNETLGDAPPRSITHVGFGVKYYPNVSEAAAAAPLAVKAGQEAAANFLVLAVPAVSLTVHCEGADDIPKHFTLSAPGLAGHQVIVREATEPGDSYNFWGVPPGRYTLRAEVQDNGRTAYAKSEIDMGATDTEASLTLQEPPKLTGAVELEGGGSLPPGFAVTLTADDTGRSVPAAVSPDGKILFPAIAPQRYRVSLMRAEDFYLKSWSVEGARRDGETFDINAGAVARLRLIIETGTCRIRGTVERGGHPLPGALVVLVPGARAAEHRAVESASDGSYEFRGVPPGDYALFAVAEGDDLEYANPTAIQPYLGAAEKVHVAAGASLNQRLTLEAPPKS